MTAEEIEILTRRLTPRPQSINFRDGAEFLLKDGCPVTVEVTVKTGIRQKLTALCKQYWNIAPELTVKESAAAKKCKPEAYQIDISAEQLNITAKNWQGVANAFKTLRQLAEAIRVFIFR